MTHSLNIGDKIEFGRYPQGADGEVLPLGWLVLALQDNYALLIADRLIDCRPYHNESVDVTWETCALRAWLGGEFMSQAFRDEEQERIAPVTLQNPGQARFEMPDSAPTRDRIFALSVEEMAHYFTFDMERKVYASPYAAKRQERLSPTGNGFMWWLRTSGASGRYAASVHFVGGVNTYGSEITDGSVMVRPSLWVRL